MKLTDLQCKTAKAGRYSDGKGLALIVRPGGIRMFQLRIQSHGRNDVVNVGYYPETSLAQARIRADVVRKKGRDILPNAKTLRERKRIAPKAAALAHGSPISTEEGVSHSFGVWAERWFMAHVAENLWSDSHTKNTRLRIDRFLADSPMWDQALHTIKKPQIADFLDSLNSGTHPKISKRQPDTANKLRGIVGGIFRYAIGKGVEGVTDPTGYIIIGTGKKRVKHNMPAIIDLNVLGGILRRVTAAQFITLPVRSAIVLLAYTAQRPGTIIAARWADFDIEGDAPVWRVPRDQMKVKDPTRDDHVLPLSPEVVAIIRALPRGEADEYLFVGSQGRAHLGPDALPKAFRETLGLRDKMVPHGWRTAFSTWAHNQYDEQNQRSRFDYDVVEFCLDHDERPATARDYHRARPVRAMRAVMEGWASVLHRAQRGEFIEQPIAHIARSNVKEL